MRAFSREIGVSDKAVRKAIASGRLKESIGKDEKGRPVVTDVALAVIEWERNCSRPAKDLRADGADGADRSALESAPAADRSASVAVFVPSATNAEAQRLATDERRRKLKMENDLRAGRLVEAEKAARQAFNAQRTIREAVLNLPARISAELAAETDPARVHIRLDAALREALMMAADAILETAV